MYTWIDHTITHLIQPNQYRMAYGKMNRFNGFSNVDFIIHRKFQWIHYPLTFAICFLSAGLLHCIKQIKFDVIQDWERGNCDFGLALTNYYFFACCLGRCCCWIIIGDIKFILFINSSISFVLWRYCWMIGCRVLPIWWIRWSIIGKT